MKYFDYQKPLNNLNPIFNSPPFLRTVSVRSFHESRVGNEVTGAPSSETDVGPRDLGDLNFTFSRTVEGWKTIGKPKISHF